MLVVDGWMHALSSLTEYFCAKGQGLIADFLPHSDAKPAKSTFVDPDSEPGLALFFFLGAPAQCKCPVVAAPPLN
jgi:hypothetical protein